MTLPEIRGLMERACQRGWIKTAGVPHATSEKLRAAMIRFMDHTSLPCFGLEDFRAFLVREGFEITSMVLSGYFIQFEKENLIAAHSMDARFAPAMYKRPETKL